MKNFIEHGSRLYTFQLTFDVSCRRLNDRVATVTEWTGKLFLWVQDHVVKRPRPTQRKDDVSVALFAYPVYPVGHGDKLRSRGVLAVPGRRRLEHDVLTYFHENELLHLDGGRTVRVKKCLQRPKSSCFHPHFRCLVAAAVAG